MNQPRTVRDSAFELFRAFGMTTVFGNPGSTELPMFRIFPPISATCLGLQESIVVAMADGYAQATPTRRSSMCIPRRARTRARQRVHRDEDPHTARDHGRPAGARNPSVRALPVRAESN
jgi:hypothetical protein